MAVNPAIRGNKGADLIWPNLLMNIYQKVRSVIDFGPFLHSQVIFDTTSRATVSNTVASTCQKFVHFYLPFHLELFLPTNTHLLIHVLTFAMISPHVLFPLSYFAFTIHTKSKPLQTPAKLIQTLIEDRSYLLTRFFARHLLQPDTVSQSFADR